MTKKTSRKEMNGERNAKGQFELGHTGMGGRPRGSRAILGEKFLLALRQEWESSGADCLKRVARDRPHDLLKVIASLMPKEIDLEAVTTLNLNLMAQRNFAEAYALALRVINGKPPVLIEAGNGRD